ncbi:MAG: hypothetical protein ACLQMT_09570 [Candidatus Acidiferrales bacterium]
MKNIYLLLVLLVAAPQLTAANIGLYDISDSSHPKPLQDQIERAAIFSTSNDNKHFELNLYPSHSFSLPCNQVELVVGSTTFRFDGQSVINGQPVVIGASIDDPKVVPQIAKYFHAKVQKRRHPGHRMLVEYIPDKEEFTAGEPLTVTLRITNVGRREFAFMEGGHQRGPRNNQFAFSAESSETELVGGMRVGRMVPDTGDPTNYGGLAGSVRLKPGQSFEIQVDLADWFKFKRGETYYVRGSYLMELVDPKTRDSDTIWEDYACAEFTVKMKD